MLLTQIGEGLPNLQHLHLRPAKSDDVQSRALSYRSVVETLQKSVKDVQNLKLSARPSFLIHLLSFGDPNVGPLSFDPAIGGFVATN
jgi:hypothetical protein